MSEMEVDVASPRRGVKRKANIDSDRLKLLSDTDELLSYGSILSNPPKHSDSRKAVEEEALVLESDSESELMVADPEKFAEEPSSCSQEPVPSEKCLSPIASSFSSGSSSKTQLYDDSLLLSPSIRTPLQPKNTKVSPPSSGVKASSFVLKKDTQQSSSIPPFPTATVTTPSAPLSPKKAQPPSIAQSISGLRAYFSSSSPAKSPTKQPPSKVAQYRDRIMQKLSSPASPPRSSSLSSTKKQRVEVKEENKNRDPVESAEIADSAGEKEEKDEDRADRADSDGGEKEARDAEKDQSEEEEDFLSKGIRKAREGATMEGDEEQEDLVQFVTETKPKRMMFSSRKENRETGEPLVLSEEGEPVVQVPGYINCKLRDYQREGVKFLYKLYKNNRGGLLADDMGLGKTIQTIAFISAVAGDAKSIFSSSSLSSGGTLKKEAVPEKKQEREIRPVLVVVPASVITQWTREVTKWSRLRADVYHDKKNRDTVLSACKHGRIQVVIASYDTFRMNFEDMGKVPWDCVIFDEVHKIKNKGSKITQTIQSVATRRRYGLTGTVMQNSFEELWTLVDFISPGYLGTLTEFRTRYINPIKNGQRHDATYGQIAKGRMCSKRLSQTIKGIILRREKSLIADTLPGKEDHIVFCPLTDTQTRIYERVLKSPDFQVLKRLCELCDCGSKQVRGDCCHPHEQLDPKETRKILLPAITTLVKIGNHPSLLEPNPKTKEKDPVKYERERQMENIAFGDEYELIKTQISRGRDEEICSKLRVLKTLMPVWKSKGNKALLFSYSTRTMDILENFLRRERVSYNRLDGSTPLQHRQKLVDNFNTSPTKFVFLISTKAGGLGLNLVSANIVVVFDPNWNVTHDLQAQDRAYRIGQTKRTTVFRLIAAGTIEEVIYHRQLYKQQLANIGLQGKNERRYFTGVQGQKGQEGELFGMRNLLKMVTDGVNITDGIIKRTKDAEQQFHIEVVKSDEKEKEAGIAGSTTTTTTVTTATEGTKEEKAELSGLLDDKFDDLKELDVMDESKDEANIMSLLRKSGVMYSHLNTEIIGESEVEKEIFKRAQVELAKAELEEQEREEARLRQLERSQFYNSVSRSLAHMQGGQPRGPQPSRAWAGPGAGMTASFAVPAQYNGVNRSAMAARTTAGLPSSSSYFPGVATSPSLSPSLSAEQALFNIITPEFLKSMQLDPSHLETVRAAALQALRNQNQAQSQRQSPVPPQPSNYPPPVPRSSLSSFAHSSVPSPSMISQSPSASLSASSPYMITPPVSASKSSLTSFPQSNTLPPLRAPNAIVPPSLPPLRLSDIDVIELDE